MSIAKLVKWGNSVGIRIPAQDLKMINSYVGEKFEVSVNSDGGLTLTPIKNSQEGWLEAFNVVADAGQDYLLINNDKDEWK